MSDSTINEMRDFLNTEHADPDDFDREAAIYWFANLYHGGQSSNLYSALSTSQYRPGASERAVPEGAEDLFNSLVEQFG